MTPARPSDDSAAVEFHDSYFDTLICAFGLTAFKPLAAWLCAPLWQSGTGTDAGFSLAAVEHRRVGGCAAGNRRRPSRRDRNRTVRLSPAIAQRLVGGCLVSVAGRLRVTVCGWRCRCGSPPRAYRSDPGPAGAHTAGRGRRSWGCRTTILTALSLVCTMSIG